LQKQFPVAHVSPAIKTYGGRSADVGTCHFNRGFQICLAKEGVYLYPDFARKSPCLIPWNKIQNVAVSDQWLSLSVNCEKTLRFIIPSDALPEVQANVSAELFSDAVSLFSAMKSAIQTKQKPRGLWKNKS
jgi:hypothetical protein